MGFRDGSRGTESTQPAGWGQVSPDSGCDSALAAEAGKVVSGVREHGEGQAARPEGSPHIALFPPPQPRVKARVPGAEPTTQQAHQWEQNQQITASDLSKWVLRPSANDEWLPRRQPCHISSPGGSERLPQCCRELGWQGGAWAPSWPLARGPELGAGWETPHG